MLSALSLKRAQGKPGAGCTHGSRATKSTGVGPQVQPERPGLPCASGVTAYTRSPWSAGLSSLHRPGIITRNLIPASGDQDHAISPSANCAVRPTGNPRPSHPAAYVRDDRDTPLFGGGMRRPYTRFSLLKKRNIFTAGLETAEPVETSGENSVLAQGAWDGIAGSRARDDPTHCELICPTSKSAEDGQDGRARQSMAKHSTRMHWIAESRAY